MVIISEYVLKHILRRHRDIARLMNIEDIGRLKEVILNIVEAPDEVYMDLFNIKYFLRRIDELYVNVVVSNDRVKTAYLISSKTYHRLRGKRWVQRLY
jgi:hypothetical protein